MANYVELAIGGKTYRIKPTFDAIDAIETALNRSILSVLASGGESFKDLKAGEVVTIAYEALVSADAITMSRAELGERIMQGGGLVEVLQPIAQYLSIAVSAGPEEPKGGLQELPQGKSGNGQLG